MISSPHKYSLKHVFFKPVCVWWYEDTVCACHQSLRDLEKQTYIGFWYWEIQEYQISRMSNCSPHTGCLVISRSPLVQILIHLHGWRFPMSSGIVTRTSLTILRSRAGCPTPTRFQTLPANFSVLILNFSWPPLLQAEGGYLEGLCENEMKVVEEWCWQWHWQCEQS